MLIYATDLEHTKQAKQLHQVPSELKIKLKNTIIEVVSLPHYTVEGDLGLIWKNEILQNIFNIPSASAMDYSNLETRLLPFNHQANQDFRRNRSQSLYNFFRSCPLILNQVNSSSSVSHQGVLFTAWQEINVCCYSRKNSTKTHNFLFLILVMLSVLGTHV